MIQKLPTDSVVYALEASKIHWRIAGGIDKGNDYWIIKEEVRKSAR
jgi:hypothetical protein